MVASPAGGAGGGAEPTVRPASRRCYGFPRRVGHDLSGWAIGAGLDLPDLEVRRPTLEEVYLTLTEDRKDVQ